MEIRPPAGRRERKKEKKGKEKTMKGILENVLRGEKASRHLVLIKIDSRIHAGPCSDPQDG